MTSKDPTSEPAMIFAERLRALRINSGLSLRALAEKTKTGSDQVLSHTTIADVLAGRRLPRWEVVQAFVTACGGVAEDYRHPWENMITATRATVSDPELDAFRHTYRQKLALVHRVAPYSPTPHRSATFDEVFVQPRLRVDSDVDQVDTEMKTPDLFESLLQPGARSVLLGDPGSGKSMLAQAITYRLATEQNSHTPFWLRLREFGDASLPSRSITSFIEHMLATRYQLTPSSGLVDQLLRAGTAVLVFDGLDELPDATRRNVGQIIQTFADAFPRVSILVTSRPAGFRSTATPFESFGRYVIAALNTHESQELMSKWSRVLEMSSSSSFETVDQDLARNPLILTMVCTAFAHHGRWPTRLDLIEQPFTMSFTGWDSIRGIKEPVPGHIRATAGHLALKLIERQRNTISRNALLKVIRTYLLKTTDDFDEASIAASEFIQHTADRTELINEVGISEAGEPQYHFVHRTFQEYLAAEHLVRNHTQPSDIAHWIRDNTEKLGWLEVSELSLELLDRYSDNGADELLTALLKELDEFSIPTNLHLFFAYAASLRLDLSDEVRAALAHFRPMASDAESALVQSGSNVLDALPTNSGL